MDKRQYVLEEYLKTRNTNYACLINGDWGSGKTYWLKNKIKPLIERTDSIDDARKKYKYLYISLYGINSVSELQNIIFLEFYYLLKNSKLKAAFDITKILGESYLKYKGFDGVGKLFTTIESHAKNYISLSRLVICFDDLERMGSALKINDLTGFINNLTENQNAKVLIFLNDKKVDDLETLRGKIEGVRITYSPNIIEVIDDIIEKNYVAYKGYSGFLRKHKDIIISLHESGLTNLRYYIYGLEKFHRVYSEVSSFFASKTEKECNVDVLLVDCLRLVLAVSYELKEGKTTEELSNILVLTSVFPEGMLAKQIQNRDNEKRDKPPRILFQERFQFKDGLIYIDSLIQYVLGYKDFDAPLFQKEIQVFTKYYIKHASVEDALLFELQQYSHIDLSDMDYISKTKSLYINAISGKYSIMNYPSIFYLIFRYENPLGYEIDDVVKELKKGIDLQVQINPNYVPFLKRHLALSGQEENHSYQVELVKYCNEVNNKLYNAAIKMDAEKSFEMFKESARGFIDEYFLGAEKKYILTPVFSSFNSQETIEALVDSNKDAASFADIIELRYDSPFDTHKLELQFLIGLKQAIDAQDFSSKPIKRAVFKRLNTALENAIIKVNSM